MNKALPLQLILLGLFCFGLNVALATNVTLIPTEVITSSSSPSYIPPVSSPANLQYRNITPDAARFCNLGWNTTCYCCDWNGYSGAVSLRSLGAIIGVCVTFLVLMICVCCFCWSTSLKDRTRFGKDKAVGADCHFIVKVLLMAIPMAMFVAGILFLIISNVNLDPTFHASSTLKDRVVMVNSALATVNEYIIQLGNTTQIDTTAVQTGLDDMKSNVNAFTSQLDSVGLGRNIIVWITCALAVIAGILSCIYVHKNHGGLFEFFCALVIFVILGACLTIAMADVVNNIADDCCSETFYEHGVLYLWQARLLAGINYVDTGTILPELSNLGDDGCSQLSSLCEQGGCCTSTCTNSCSPNSVEDFLNRTLIDGSVFRNISSCSLECTNSTIRNYSKSFVDDINELQAWEQFRSALLNLLQLQDPNLVTDLRGLVCNNGPAVGGIIGGCGLLIGGSLIAVILCLLLRGKKADVSKS